MSAPEDLVQAARDWASDCVWAESPEDIAAMSVGEILHGVDSHYTGGLAQLARDAFLGDSYASWQAAGRPIADEEWAR